jgi:prepilin-type N-terminal cleavage/methylation domain-containing protein
MTSAPNEDRGFTLVEVLAAMVLVALAVMNVANLIVLAVRVAWAAETETMSAVLASQKLEELRSVFAGTVPSVGGSLQVSLAGFSDDLDVAGRPASPASAVYVRRWATGPVAGTPDVGLLQVLVTTHVADRPIAAAGGARARHRNEALLATLTGRR